MSYRIDTFEFYCEHSQNIQSVKVKVLEDKNITYRHSLYECDVKKCKNIYASSCFALKSYFTNLK